MAPSRRLLVTVLALLISASFIAAGYVLSSPFDELRANAVSTEELLRDYAKKDTDSDGLPDWQEELYGADPANAHSLDPVLSDKEAVDQGTVAPRFVSETPVEERPSPESYFDGEPGPTAGSYTEQFSRRFLEAYITAGGQALDETSQQRVLDNLIAEFAQKSEEAFGSTYSASSVRSSSAISAAMYAANLEGALDANEVEDGSEDPLPLLQAYIETGDMTAKEKLRTLARAQAALVTAFVRMDVPSSFATDHLELVRALDTLSKASFLVAEEYESDPVLAFGAISAYGPALESVATSLTRIAARVSTEVNPVPGMPGARLVEFAQTPPTP